MHTEQPIKSLNQNGSAPEPSVSESRISLASLFGAKIDCAGRTVAEMVALARGRLATHRACYLRRFPPEVATFTDFLGQLGELQQNYGASSGLPNYSLHPAINRVHLHDRPGSRRFFHERGGGLPIHSARSWSLLRPTYFAMLMVDPGWTDEPETRNGESICVRWRDVFELARTRAPGQFARDFALLSRTPLEFAANTVVEPNSRLPIIYTLSDARDEYDFGVRLKVDILDKLPALEEQVADMGAYADALRRFIADANNPEVRVSYAMSRGDLVMVDNHRFGHGRLHMVPQRGQALNPRELWSVSVVAPGTRGEWT